MVSMGRAVRIRLLVFHAGSCKSFFLIHVYKASTTVRRKITVEWLSLTTYISSPLMRKLKRAKQNAYKNNNIAWKFLSKQLAALQKSALHKMTNETINESIQGSKRWWHNVKKLTGDKHVTNQPAVMFMEDTWLSTEEFVNKLNSYYVQDHNEVVFPEIPSAGIPISVTEMEVFKFLEDIGTHKATSSADYASWISKKQQPHIMRAYYPHCKHHLLYRRIS